MFCGCVPFSNQLRNITTDFIYFVIITNNLAQLFIFRKVEKIIYSGAFLTHQFVEFDLTKSINDLFIKLPVCRSTNRPKIMITQRRNKPWSSLKTKICKGYSIHYILLYYRLFKVWLALIFQVSKR